MDRKTPRKEPLLGAHMSIAGGFDRAAKAAGALGCTTLQVFTKNTNQWAARPLQEPAIRAFREALAENGLSRPAAHNSYLINLASPDDALWQRSIDAMTVELERAEALGIGDLVAHPGAHMGAGEDAGLARVAAGIDEVLRRTAGMAVILDLETTAGQGTCLGHRFEHLRAILDRVRAPERLGVCVDTCHVFAAGYSLEGPDDYNRLIDELGHIIGLDRVRLWHVNDSAKGLGSRVDRHAGLGRGLIGEAAFGCLVTDPRFRGVPMILETPKGVEDGEDLDARNLAILRRLCRQGRPRADRRNKRP